MELTYLHNGDYYIPNISLPEESRPIGKWGRMHREFLKEHHPVRFNALVLSGKLWTVLADLNEQPEGSCSLLPVTLFPFPDHRTNHNQRNLAR